jgi:hypothetical protein
VAYWDIGDYVEVVASFDKALKIDDRVNFTGGKASAFSLQDRHEEIEDWQSAIDIMAHLITAKHTLATWHNITKMQRILPHVSMPLIKLLILRLIGLTGMCAVGNAICTKDIYPKHTKPPKWQF